MSEFPIGGPIALEPGDLILLFTDGVFEARSAEGMLFGLDRVLQVVRDRIELPNEADPREPPSRGSRLHRIGRPLGRRHDRADPSHRQLIDAADLVASDRDRSDRQLKGMLNPAIGVASTSRMFPRLRPHAKPSGCVASQLDTASRAESAVVGATIQR